MHYLLNILSESTSLESGTSEAVSVTFWDPVSIIVCTVGLCILTGWLFWFGGFGALREAPVRRHRREFIYWPMGIWVIWIFNLIGIEFIIQLFFESQPDPVQTIISYFIHIVLEISLIVIMLLVAQTLFARGIKGLGLTSKSPCMDAAMATVYLVGIFPLILGGLFFTFIAGRLIAGPEFSLQVHQSLEILTDASRGLRMTVVAFAVFVVPLFEELLFRGFIQTMLRSLSGGPWTAIVFTSLFFAILHPPTHIAALFMLSCGLGYAYERSGSLIRPILMHILFNGANVAMTLLLPP